MLRKRRSNTLSIILAVVGFGLLMKVLLFGHNVALLNAKGLIASEESKLMWWSVGVMLTVAVPTVFLLYFIAWKYRETNPKAKREDKSHGHWFDVAAWGIPAAFMLVLAMVMVPAAHRLDPKQPIVVASGAKPVHIQVVALRWKWLFIYPEQKIASVNFVQMPVNTPVQFDLTADEAPMSSFWIPNLGGMLYAMTGHSNRINLMANAVGEYPGSTAEITGAGFADMKFTARASSRADFDQWVRDAQESPEVLDDAAYANLVKPSEANKAAVYATDDPDLYDKVLMKYSDSMGGHMHMEGATQ
jgi:cytochrome o ubiquinol oxidase subunit 2